MRFYQKVFKPRRTEEEQIFFNTLTDILGFSPINLEHYYTAFLHRSLQKLDEEGNPLNYERLEFLGDAMLGAVIASYLYKKVPTGNEGYLTQMRSKIVNRKHLNELGYDLNLVSLVKSNVPTSNFGENVHGNVFEALVGAIYLDRGYKYCKKFTYYRVIVPYVDIDKLEGKVTSYKSIFIEWCQQNKHSFKYEVYEDTGKDVLKHFSVKLYLNGKIIAKGRATSKKKAEETASKRACYANQEEILKR